MDTFDCTQVLEFDNFKAIRETFEKPLEQVAYLLPLAKDKTKSYPLREGENVVGRGTSCSVRIENKALSKKHAVLEIERSHYFVQDQNSLNGTFKGKVRLKPLVMYSIEVGDTLMFGNVGFKLSLHKHEMSTESSPAISPTQVCSVDKDSEEVKERVEPVSVSLNAMITPVSNKPVQDAKVNEPAKVDSKETETAKVNDNVTEVEKVETELSSTSDKTTNMTEDGSKKPEVKRKRTLVFSSDDETDSELEEIISKKGVASTNSTESTTQRGSLDDETASESEFEAQKIMVPKHINQEANNLAKRTPQMETQDFLDDELPDLVSDEESLLLQNPETDVSPKNQRCLKCNGDLSVGHLCLDLDESSINSRNLQDSLLLRPTQPYSSTKSDENSETQNDSLLLAPTQPFIKENKSSKVGDKKVEPDNDKTNDGKDILMMPTQPFVSDASTAAKQDANDSDEDPMMAATQAFDEESFAKPTCLPPHTNKNLLPSSGDSVDPNAFTQPCLSLDDFEEVDDFDCESSLTKMDAETQPTGKSSKTCSKVNLLFAETQPLVNNKSCLSDINKNDGEDDLLFEETQPMVLNKKASANPLLLAETQPLLKSRSRLSIRNKNVKKDNSQIKESQPRDRNKNDSENDLLFEATQPMILNKKTYTNHLQMVETQPMLKSRSRLSNRNKEVKEDNSQIEENQPTVSNENKSIKGKADPQLLAETQPLVNSKAQDKNNKSCNKEDSTQFGETQPMVFNKKKGSKCISDSLLLAETQPLLRTSFQMSDSDEDSDLLTAETQVTVPRKTQIAKSNEATPNTAKFAQKDKEKKNISKSNSQSEESEPLKIDSNSDTENDASVSEEPDWLNAETQPFGIRDVLQKSRRQLSSDRNSPNTSTPKGLQFEESFVGNVSKESEILCADSQSVSTPKYTNKKRSLEGSSIAETPSSISASSTRIKSLTNVDSFNERICLEETFAREGGSSSSANNVSSVLSSTEPGSLTSTLKDSSPKMKDSVGDVESCSNSVQTVRNVQSCSPTVENTDTVSDDLQTLSKSETEVSASSEQTSENIMCKSTKPSRLSKKARKPMSAKGLNHHQVPEVVTKADEENADRIISETEVDVEGSAHDDKVKQQNKKITGANENARQKGRNQKRRIIVDSTEESNSSSDRGLDSKPRASSRVRRLPLKLQADFEMESKLDENQNAERGETSSADLLSRSSTDSADGLVKSAGKSRKPRKNLDKSNENCQNISEKSDVEDPAPDGIAQKNKNVVTESDKATSFDSEPDGDEKKRKIKLKRKGSPEKLPVVDLTSDLSESSRDLGASSSGNERGLENPVSSASKAMEQKNAVQNKNKSKKLTTLEESSASTESHELLPFPENNNLVTEKSDGSDHTSASSPPLVKGLGTQKRRGRVTKTKRGLTSLVSVDSNALSLTTGSENASKTGEENGHSGTSKYKSRQNKTVLTDASDSISTSHKQGTRTRSVVTDSVDSGLSTKEPIAVDLPAPKRKGRQPKTVPADVPSDSKHEDAQSSSVNTGSDSTITAEDSVTERMPVSKRKGRPKKDIAASSTPNPPVNQLQNSSSGKRKTNSAVIESVDSVSTADDSSTEKSQVPKRRGRPKKEVPAPIPIGSHIQENHVSDSPVAKRKKLVGNKSLENETEKEKDTSVSDLLVSSKKSGTAKKKLDTPDDFEEARTEAVSSTRRGRTQKQSKALPAESPSKSSESHLVLSKKRPSSSESSGTPVKRRNQKVESSSSSERQSSDRSASHKKPISVLFTGISDEESEQVITSLGGKTVTDVTSCSHLCTDKFRRTVKFLCCVAKGIPIVGLDWILACKKEKHFVDPERYILQDKEAEKTYSFQLSKTLMSSCQSPLFTNWSIYVTPAVVPGPEQMKEIILCAGGKFLTKSPSRFMDQILIISCETDKKAASRFSKMGFPVVTNEFVLTGLIRHKICFKEFSFQL